MLKDAAQLFDELAHFVTQHSFSSSTRSISMRRTIVPHLVVTLFFLGSTSLFVQAQEPRLAAFTLQCFVPTTPGYHTRATLIGTFTLQNRTIWTVASCADGPSPSTWPAFDASDGAVETVELIVVTVLEDAQQQLVAYNYCSTYGQNGFFSFRCMADTQQGGEVNVLVSIAP
jgi:hypothetical protein